LLVLTEKAVIVLFLAFFAVEFFLDFLLNELNLRYVRARWAERSVPDFFQGKITSEDYDKSFRYTLARGRFSRWSEVYGAAITLAVLFSGVLPVIDSISLRVAVQYAPFAEAQGILFCAGVGLIFAAASLPTDLYSTFRLEARFGFNKTTPKVYITDKLKALLLGIVIGGPFLFVVLWLMSVMGQYWWIWAFLFISGFQLLMIVIFPTLIAPLFNKFEPLKEGEFRDRILALAKQIGFKTSGIYSMDGSKRSGHSNAYFTGIGKAKRIVLFDTLIDKMSVDQGLAVLAHEMGHYKMKHIRRMLIVQTGFLLGGLYVISLLLHYEPLFYAFGLAPSNHAALVLFSLLAGTFIFPVGPLMNFLSRKHEYEADRFAVQTLRNAKPMEEALVNLTVQNLSNLTPHPWYSAYHYSHPTTVERVSAIREAAASLAA
jgi:STE24 endopeptidase